MREDEIAELMPLKVMKTVLENLTSIAESLATLASCVKDGTFQMRTTFRGVDYNTRGHK